MCERFSGMPDTMDDWVSEAGVRHREGRRVSRSPRRSRERREGEIGELGVVDRNERRATSDSPEEIARKRADRAAKREAMLASAPD